MDNQKVFYSLVSGFTLGIFLCSFFKIGFSFFLLLIILSIVAYVYAKYIAKEKVAILLFIIFIFFFAMGVLRYEVKDLSRENNLNSFVSEKVILTGIIDDEPNLKDKSNQLVVQAESISTGSANKNISGKVLVTAGLFPEYKYGDLIEVEGKLEKPQNFSTTTANSFNYIGYLAKDDIHFVMNFTAPKVISSGHGSWSKEKLFAFKRTFINMLNLQIKEPESSLLGGLLLGAKNSLGQDLQTDFRQAGVSHIVALSGYNITIVAESIMIALSFLPKLFSLSFGVLGIVIFTIMTGAGATVVRASIMALLVLLSKSTNRKYDISRALLLAGVFMLIQNPKILVFDVSFQLSFLATVALIYISPIIEKKMTFITEKYQLRSLIGSTISTQIFVLPFILYKMGTLSLVALPTNLLILPVIPLIMLLGFITAVLGFISITLAVPVAIICSFLLSYTLKVIYIFAHLPFSTVNILNFSTGLMVIVYMVFLVIIWKEKTNEKP